ncbi:hypothetical protein ACJX0J_029145, partial [Zea mays]
ALITHILGMNANINLKGHMILGHITHWVMHAQVVYALLCYHHSLMYWKLDRYF